MDIPESLKKIQGHNMTIEVYKCDTCGVTSTRPEDALLKYFCRCCVQGAIKK